MIKSLQGLRSIATLLIFTFHSGLLFVSPFPVTLFFILSGFFYFITFVDVKDFTFKRSLKYAYNRMLTFYPLYIVTFILSIVIRQDWFLGKTLKYLLIGIPLDLLMLKSLFAEYTYQFNGLSWYLSTLMVLYVTIFPFGKYVKELNKIIYVFISVIILLFIQFVLVEYKIPENAYSSPLYRVLDFSLGMLIAKLYLLNFRLRMKHSCLFVAFVFFMLYLVDYIYQWCSLCLYNLYFFILILLLLSNENKITRYFSKDVFLVLAVYSFQFYMFHELVLICFRMCFSNSDIVILNHPWMSKILISLFSLVVTSLITYITYNPFLQINKWMKKWSFINI